MAIIMSEVHPEIWDDPRSVAFERFGEWLSMQADFGLPPGDTEVVLELMDGDLVDPVLANGDDAVGVWLQYDPYRRHTADEWRVVVAIGTPDEDAADFAARLTSVAHELTHIAQFWGRHGTTPAALERTAGMAPFRRSEAEVLTDENEAEAAGRRLTSRFLREYPEFRR